MFILFIETDYFRALIWYSALDVTRSNSRALLPNYALKTPWRGKPSSRQVIYVLIFTPLQFISSVLLPSENNYVIHMYIQTQGVPRIFTKLKQRPWHVGFITPTDFESKNPHGTPYIYVFFFCSLTLISLGTLLFDGKHESPSELPYRWSRLRWHLTFEQYIG